MSSGCGDVLSLEDLKTAKKHQVFEAEVITGLAGGVAGGASIDYATNPVTLQVQKTLPAIMRDAGFEPASFDFTTGGTLTTSDRNKVVFDPVSMTWYSWAGALPKVIPAATNPLADSNWIPQTDPDLRTELASSTGYTLIPSMDDHIAELQWRSQGDIRGWGAVCDGVTNDSPAIALAIAATSGNIVIPGPTKISTHVLMSGLTDIRIRGVNKAALIIDTAFTFNPSYRGIIALNNCSGVGKISGVKIVGAKVDKTNAAEPWQDGDAGVEAVSCSGRLEIDNIYVQDVKTWGVIVVECPNLDRVISNSYFKNCQVQSAIGGTGYKSTQVINCEFDDIGLYGVELETRDSNAETTVSSSIARLCNKGFSSVHNSDKIMFSGCRAINCKTGYSLLSDNSGDESYRGDDQTVMGCIADSCKTSFELVYPRQAALMNNVETRQSIDYYVRTRALDRIVKFSGSTAYIALDSVSENPGLTVGMVIQLDDGAQYTLATVDASNTSDPVFGYMRGFTTTTTLPSSYLRSSFRRYVQVSTDKTSVVLYGGSDVTIKGNKFSWASQVLASYGDHTNLLWEGNTTYSCVNYIAIGSTGAVTGSMKVEKGQNVNAGTFGGGAKFGGIQAARMSYIFRGGTTNAETAIQHAVSCDNAWIGRVHCAINSGYTTSGTPVLRVNGADIISGGFTGTPARANAVLPSTFNISDVCIVQLTDTVGDIVATGYSVTMYGAFMY